ncbi:TonB-dependent receptor [bacterium]|nr:TonB-dependent receptor [bacterium]
MYISIFLLHILFFSSNFETQIDEIIIQDTITPQQKNGKTKREKLETTESQIQRSEKIFIRQSGGVGQPIKLYYQGVQTHQLDMEINGFSYKIPSIILTEIPSLSGTVFSDTNIENSKISFTLPKENQFNFQSGSWGTLKQGANFYDKNSGVSIGGVVSYSENNFKYIDFHNKNRVRKNNQVGEISLYSTVDYGLDSSLLYINLSSRGAPGSDQFEHLESDSNRINLLVASKKSFKKIELKGSYNLRQFRYYDGDPQILGLKEVESNLKIDDFLLESKYKTNLSDFFEGGLSLNGEFYSGEYQENNSKKIEKSQIYPKLSIFGKSYFFDDYLEISTQFDILYNKTLYFLPNIETKLDLDPFKIIFLLSKNIRTPYFEELYFRSDGVQGNPNLVVESFKTAQLSLIFKKSIVDINFNIYYKKIENEILFLPKSFSLLAPENIKPSFATGGSIKFNIESKYLSITQMSSYQIHRFQDETTQLPYSPKWINKTSISLKYWYFKFDIDRYHSTSYYNNIFETDEIYAKSRWNSSISFIKNSFGTIIKCENIFNSLNHYDTLHMPLPSRGFFVDIFIKI